MYRTVMNFPAVIYAVVSYEYYIVIVYSVIIFGSI